jgi:hypothetical protein
MGKINNEPLPSASAGGKKRRTKSIGGFSPAVAGGGARRIGADRPYKMKKGGLAVRLFVLPERALFFVFAEHVVQF